MLPHIHTVGLSRAGPLPLSLLWWYIRVSYPSADMIIEVIKRTRSSPQQNMLTQKHDKKPYFGLTGGWLTLWITVSIENSEPIQY